MSAEPLDDTNEERAGATGTERFVELDTDDGLILYDRTNHRAWLEADAPVALADRR